ncbi:DUF5342 family protein [Alteribacter natronophilus]|uniref:DUF5342 family protein n=1 Tax=Alteribacter natronophilus TaxID=2583810 RepID=UPI00110E6030|nr:DUF5342 family protein [Alteribacter natronophilus]TMW74032.1 hypothetical protein FGB90_07135 [Alteribacter natronophilus]
MLSHFHYTEIKNNMINREWGFEFYYRQTKHKGKYFKDGTIEWIQPGPSELTEKDRTFLETCVHDLMLYHVYEDH